MKRIANVLEIVFIVFIIFLCIIIFMAGKGNVPYVFGYRILQVISNSMSPAVDGETCIIIKKVDSDDIKQGDIITFISEDPRIKGYYNTHRVHSITADSKTGEILFITKGDAVDTVDDFPVRTEQIIGKYVGEMPFGELIYKMIYLLSDRVNYFVIVMLPLVLCFLSYLKELISLIFSNEEKTDE